MKQIEMYNKKLIKLVLESWHKNNDNALTCNDAQAVECMKIIAEVKDKQLKQFLSFHISVDYKGKVDKDGNPIDMEEYLRWLEKNQKALEEVFNTFEEFCNNSI